MVIGIYCIIFSVDCIVLSNSVDSNETWHFAAFHLGFHCLSKYPLRGIQSMKD